MAREAKLIGTEAVAVDEIDISDRLRPVTGAGVAQLIASVEQLGHFTDPIQVRRVAHRDNALVLMAGAHRVEAAKAMGHETIRAQIWDCNDNQARLFEIDDNLASRELTALERAVFMAERKKVYLALYPETAAGGDHGNQHTGGRQTELSSFCQVTAETLNISDRQVRKYVSIGEQLSADEAKVLMTSPIGTNLKELDRLVRARPDDRAKLFDAIKGSSPPSLREAKARTGLLPPTPPDEEKKMGAMDSAWIRLSAKLKKRWLLELLEKEEIALIDDDDRVLVDFLEFKLSRPKED